MLSGAVFLKGNKLHSSIADDHSYITKARTVKKCTLSTFQTPTNMQTTMWFMTIGPNAGPVGVSMQTQNVHTIYTALSSRIFTQPNLLWTVTQRKTSLELCIVFLTTGPVASCYVATRKKLYGVKRAHVIRFQSRLRIVYIIYGQSYIGPKLSFSFHHVSTDGCVARATGPGADGPHRSCSSNSGNPDFCCNPDKLEW